jgi:pyridoxine/pyridoxamine 5'-phosphate oxidase
MFLREVENFYQLNILTYKGNKLHSNSHDRRETNTEKRMIYRQYLLHVFADYLKVATSGNINEPTFEYTRGTSRQKKKTQRKVLLKITNRQSF